MGKNRSRPSVIVPYHTYHFKDDMREFDFVCLKVYEIDNNCNCYKLMMLNYSTEKYNFKFITNTDYQCGEIKSWYIQVGQVTFLENSKDYIKNAIKLAKLMYM